MCGIFGFFSNEAITDQQLNHLRKATDIMDYRGPDGYGEWLSPDRKTYLAHRRLSIIDVTEGSSQPMHRDGHVLCFNGEIYNYLEIRAELIALGISFHTTGDTEVLLMALQTWGIQALDKLDGMFSFAWVNPAGEAVMATDCFGEKPLFTYQDRSGVFFSSEIQPILYLRDPEFSIGPDQLTAFLSLGFFLDGFTGYRSLTSIGPAALVKVKEGKALCSRYWAPPAAHQSEGKLIEPSNIDEIESILTESLRRRLRSDVPLCVFLSSGVDSTLVAALATCVIKSDLNAFTVSFPDGVDESEDARRIAEYFKMKHEVVSNDGRIDFSTASVLDLFGIPNDNITGLSIQQMSHLARKKYTVALSGLGGDELFFGYNKYQFAYKNRRAYAVGRYLSRVSPLGSFGRKMFPESNFVKYTLGNAAEQLAALKLQGRHGNVPQLLGKENLFSFDLPSERSFWKQTRSFDLNCTLPFSYIPAVDRGSMRASLEVRTPFLSRQLLEYLGQFRQAELIRNGPKWILKKILEKYMPLDLLSRQKKGFVTPTQRLLSDVDLTKLSDHLPMNREALRAIWERRHEPGYQTLAVRCALLSAFFERNDLKGELPMRPAKSLSSSEAVNER